MKLTRHNGRSGPKGNYRSVHNDRNFNMENAEHIDVEKVRENIYWDCYQGFRDNDSGREYVSFEDVEILFYAKNYLDFVENQNERNEKNRHPERNRSTEDIYKNKRTCPEESILQIGNMDNTVPAEVLVNVATDFFTELDRRYGSCLHILDWALHMDETTPHIHERHVFDCENKYGEICPQQEKALEKLGIELPNPEKPPGKNNNRKMTFDAECRNLLMDISEKYRLDLDREPEYGGRAYMEKQEYILMAQKQKLEVTNEALKEASIKLSDIETLVDRVSDVAYEKACEVVADTVQDEVISRNIDLIKSYGNEILKDRKIPDKEKSVIKKHLSKIIADIKNMTKEMFRGISRKLKEPSVREANKTVIRNETRKSVKEMLLEKAKSDAEAYNASIRNKKREKEIEI